MFNFRNVVVGPSEIGSTLKEWPKLGEEKTKTCTGFDPKKPSVPVDSHPKSSAGNERAPSLLDTHEFPALDKCFTHKPRDSRSWNLPQDNSSAKKKPSKKKVKRSTPLQVDICEIIQASALKKKQKCETLALKKSAKIKRKVIGGNHLDADQPKRHKGKVRPWKPRDLSKTKKIICASRKIRLSRLNYSRDMLRFKECLGNALKVGQIDVENLVKDLSEVRLNETKSDQTAAIKIATDIVHNKKFRSYCNHLVTPELKHNASELIITLRKFQDRMHAKDEIKAHAKRRYVCGFNESRRFLLADRVKLLLVATNLEMEEGLPSMAILKTLVDAANEREIPVVYAGLGHNLGYWTLKKTKISAVAVMNYDGANDIYAKLMKSWAEAKAEYDKLIKHIMDLCTTKLPELVTTKEIKKEVEDEIKESILKKLQDITINK